MEYRNKYPEASFFYLSLFQSLVWSLTHYFFCTIIIVESKLQYSRFIIFTCFHITF